MDDLALQNVFGALALAVSDGILRGAGLRAPEPGPAAAAIALIRHDPGISIEVLRRALPLSHPAAVRLVDRLASEGLVERRPSKDDRRAVALYLTDDGEKSCDAILAERQNSLAAALRTLDAKERQMLGVLSRKLLANMIGSVEDAYCTCRLCDAAICASCPVDAALEQTATTNG